VPAIAIVAADTGRDLCGLGNPLKGDEDAFVGWGEVGNCGMDPGLFITRPGENDHGDVMLPVILAVLEGNCWVPIGTTLLRRTAFTPVTPAAAISDSGAHIRFPSENRLNLLLMSCHTRAGTAVP